MQHHLCFLAKRSISAMAELFLAASRAQAEREAERKVGPRACSQDAGVGTAAPWTEDTPVPQDGLALHHTAEPKGSPEPLVRGSCLRAGRHAQKDPKVNSGCVRRSPRPTPSAAFFSEGTSPRSLRGYHDPTATLPNAYDSFKRFTLLVKRENFAALPEEVRDIISETDMWN